MFERFTDRARRVMGHANQEAIRYQHASMGTEHILLGLIKEGSAVAANALRNLGVDMKRIRVDIEKKVPCGHEMITVGKLPYTPRAKRVIEMAFQEARSLGHNYVGTEHLLLGLIRETEGVAAQVLAEQNLKLEEVRQEVMRLLGYEPSPEGAPSEVQQEAKQSGAPAGQKLKDTMEILLEIAKEDPSSGRMASVGRLPFTLAAAELIERAFKEANALGRAQVDREHLLLAVLDSDGAILWQVLEKRGLKRSEVLDEIAGLLGKKPDGGKHV